VEVLLDVLADLEIRMQLAQLVGDGDVAPCVPEADRRGDEERTLAPPSAARPTRGRGRGRRDEPA
jgi:hypothetical protein